MSSSIYLLSCILSAATFTIFHSMKKNQMTNIIPHSLTLSILYTSLTVKYKLSKRLKFFPNINESSRITSNTMV